MQRVFPGNHGVGGFVVSDPECIVIEDGKAKVLPR